VGWEEKWEGLLWRCWGFEGGGGGVGEGVVRLWGRGGGVGRGGGGGGGLGGGGGCVRDSRRASGRSFRNTTSPPEVVPVDFDRILGISRFVPTKKTVVSTVVPN